ncbi:MAG: NB-ARC domain-containing protein [bacterium]|nr:NB-ARC domain-containing protein [bacterium]
MLDQITLGVLTNIVYDGGKVIFSKVTMLALGAEETRALNAAYKAALQHTLDWVRDAFLPGLAPAEQRETIQRLRDFFNDDRVWETLVSVARSDIRDRQSIQAALNGFLADQKDVAVVHTFLLALSTELIARAGQKDSALTNLVQMDYLTHLRDDQREVLRRLNQLDTIETLVRMIAERPTIPQPTRACPTPPHRPTHFGGRDVPLAELRTRLRDGTLTAITAVHGGGGIGKTTLALQLANEVYADDTFAAVLWATVGQQPDTRRILRDWLSKYCGEADFPEGSSDLAGYIRPRLEKAVREECARQGRVLLVLDDVWAGEDEAGVKCVRLLCEAVPAGAVVLMTTRVEALARKARASVVTLDYFAPEEGAAVLKTVDDFKDLTDDLLKTLSIALGGHALSLDLAARRITLERRPGETMAARFERLTKDYAAGIPAGSLFATLQLGEGDQKEDNLERSLELSYNVLKPDAQRHFCALGILAYDTGFSPQLLGALWGLPLEEVYTAANTLESLALLEIDGDSYRQHPLLRAYARALLMQQGELDETAAQHFTYLAALHGADRDHTNTDYLQSISTDFDNIRAALEWGLTHRVEAACDFLSTLGNYLRVYQGTQVYQPLLNTALNEARKAGYSRGEANTLQALGDLSVRLDELDAAKGYYDAALPLFRTIGDRLGEANTLMCVGDMLVGQKRWKEACTYYEPALLIARNINARLSIANILYDYGLALFESGQQEAGLSALRECVAIFEVIDPRNWANTARRRINQLLQRAGQIDETSSSDTLDEGKAAEGMQMLVTLYNNPQGGPDAVRALLAQAGMPDVMIDLMIQVLEQASSGGADGG